MFKLIAALFVITNGVPGDEPASVLSYNHVPFETEESCMEFLGTDVGRAAVVGMNMSARSQGVAIKFACVKAEDNTI